MVKRWDTHACCEACWIKHRGTRGPLGDIISVPRPYYIRQGEDTPPVDKCCWCGAMTIVGIYQRAESATLRCLGDPDYGPVHADSALA